MRQSGTGSPEELKPSTPDTQPGNYPLLHPYIHQGPERTAGQSACCLAIGFRGLGVRLKSLLRLVSRGHSGSSLSPGFAGFF
jgi:hypothetical protein